MAKVTVINFGDGSRVLFNENKRPREVPVGMPVSIDLSERTLKKLKADATIVVIPEGKDLQQDNPHLVLALDTLRDFDSTPYDDILHVVDKVMGRGAMGQRPLRVEVRQELARRAGLAAHYIQQGAVEKAEKVLSGPVSRKIPQAPGTPTGEKLETSKAGMVIKGDEEEGDELRGEDSGESDGEEGQEGEADGTIIGDQDQGEDGSEEGEGGGEEGGEGGSEEEQDQAGQGGGEPGQGEGGGKRVKRRRRRGRQSS